MLGNGPFSPWIECLSWDPLEFDLALSCSPAGKPWRAANILERKREATRGFKEGSEPLNSQSKSESDLDSETSESSFLCRLQCGDVMDSPCHHTVVK